MSFIKEGLEMHLYIQRKTGQRDGFTLIEIVIAVAIVAIFAAALTPMVFKHLEEAKISKAKNETDVIGNAIMSLYKDTGKWPYTNANGPTGTIDRVISSNNVAIGNGAGAASGAANWGAYGTSKQLGDYLFYNNPDDDSSDTGVAAGTADDYELAGSNQWQGPYIEQYQLDDPWGNAYVVNVRYMPGGRYTGSVLHRVFVLSAGPDGRWQTGYSDAATEQTTGDDIGTLVMIK